MANISQIKLPNNTTHNITLPGLTATTAELNVLDGITATTTELNYTDGVTSNIQTQLNTTNNKFANYLPLSGGTMTGELIVNGGDAAGGSKLVLATGSGQITNSGTQTLFGFLTAEQLAVGHNDYKILLRGSARPTYNGSNIALQSEIPTNYAGSSSAGGSATSAEKLTTTTAGDLDTPVYFNNGVPVACTGLDLDTSGSAGFATSAGEADEFASAANINITGAVVGNASSVHGWDINTTLVDGVVTNAKLADDAITTAKLADDAVTTANIASSAVTNTELAANSVSTEKIIDGSITLSKFASEVGVVVVQSEEPDSSSAAKIWVKI